MASTYEQALIDAGGNASMQNAGSTYDQALKDSQTPISLNLPPVNVTPKTSMMDDFSSALGHHLANPLHGTAQFIENGVDYAASKFPDNSVSRAIHNTVAQDNQAMNQREQDYQASTPNSPSAYTGATVGEVAPFAVSGVTQGIQSVGNAAMKLMPTSLGKFIPQAIGGAAQGATIATAQPVTKEGDYWDNKGNQEKYGAVGGAAGPTAINGLASVIAPSASKAYNSLANSGVKTTLGQRLGGAMNSMEEKAQSLPIVGDFIAKARGRALDSWNASTLNEVVSSIGGKVTATGHEGVAQAGDMVSAAYNKGKNMLGGFSVDPQASKGLSTLGQGVIDATNLTPQGKNAFNKMMDLVKQQISPNGSMLANGYKEIDSKLTKEIASYSGSTDAYQKNLGDAFKQLQAVITDNAKRANPAAASLIDNADMAWAKLVRVEGAAKAAASNKVNTGVFTPSQLMSAVRGADQSVRDRSTARGDALMQGWAQDGLKVLGDKVPNSGTFDRGANAALIAALAANPHYIAPAAIGIGAGSAMYSPLGQKMAIGLTTRRPPQAQSLANMLRRYVPSLTP